MSLPLDEFDQITPGMISTRDLLEPIFMRTVYAGVIAPLLFAYFGSSNVLAPYIEQSQWLVSRMAPIWPVLPAQYELVLETRGPGHAASYGFMCAALWAWPVICAAAFLWAHGKRRKEILPISPKEIGQFIVVFPFAVLVLVFDRVKIAEGLYGFHADQWYFYLLQWLMFGLVAIVLAIFIYAIGGIILDRVQSRVN
jgi:hypothetical protein